MKIIIFANKMPDLCGAFLHDVDLGTELVRRGHQVIFLTFKVPPEGYNGGSYRGFRYLHYSAGASFLETSNIWVCPHAPVLPDVRKLNSRGYSRPIVVTCHYDGNYTAITRNGDTGWVEMLLFINGIMEPNYRKNISPWPRQIIRTAAIRPIMHRDQIVITEEHHGEYITLVNANENKGVHQFLDMARRMPDRKFLGILPYYGNIRIPPNPPTNIKWIPFDNDIRNILKETRILLMPSYYESFGRVAVEAMINGIPVIYSKPTPTSIYPGGSTEGIEAWIGDAGIQATRDNIEEWAEQIRRLDDRDVYSARSIQCKNHIDSLNLFTEATRIAEMVETFSRENPVVLKVQQSSATPQVDSQREAPRLRQPVGPVGFGFSNGRLKIQR
jgi:glycosyltransferase involved in cell wall biosynthesis